MKTLIAAAVASLLVASMGTVAYAQQTTPQTTPPSSSYMNQSTTNDNMSHNNRSSTQTEQKIKQELTSHGVTATNVNVSFSAGTATLSGTVATQSDIAKAKSAAMRVRGVKHVDTSNLQASAQTGAMQH